MKIDKKIKSYGIHRNEEPLAICSKCKCELYYLDLILPFKRKCHDNKKSSKMIHFSNLYNKLDFKEDFSKINDRLNKYINKAKKMMIKIIALFFPIYITLLNFSNKTHIEQEPFFIEECLPDFKNMIKKLENNNIRKDVIKKIKNLMLDINTFIIILKKYPSLVIYDCPLLTRIDFNLLNVLYYSNIKTRNKLIETIDEYINKKKIIEKSFDDGYKYSIYSKPIKSILPIIEKQLILVLLHNRKIEYHFEFRLYNLYDIGDNNYLLSKELFISIPVIPGEDYVYYSHIKLYKIPSRSILMDYCTNKNTHLSFL